MYGVDDTITNDENTNHKVTGYIETNEIWYENEHQKAYMFFGDGNISWYCYDIKRDIYVELDKPSGSLVQEFQGFYHMIDYALSESL
ncbi:YrhA family protein [Paenibacillus macerans]|uniref:YrhA family protein n=1 Tax=Paenibacillus macerans TaxID=44252 RepID=UPI0037C64EFC